MAREAHCGECGDAKVWLVEREGRADTWSCGRYRDWGAAELARTRSRRVLCGHVAEWAHGLDGDGAPLVRGTPWGGAKARCAVAGGGADDEVRLCRLERRRGA